jgi:glycosyltransferase involved in cell wall biosynthesis
MSKSVLLLGYFASANGKFNRAVCEDLADELENSGWKVIRASSKPNRYFRLLEMLSTSWFRQKQYQVAQVDLFSGRAFRLAELVCTLLRLIRKPYILTLHGGQLPEFSTKYSRRVRYLLNSAAAVTTPSNYLLEAMQPYRGDIILIPNPITLKNYHFRVRDKLEPQLLWLRALHTIYNPTLAISVINELVQNGINAHLYMVGPDKGDGSKEAVLESINQYGLQDRIKLIGGVPKQDIPDWLDRADILINTTNADNTPISLLEAMACGLIIVSTNVGGIPTLVKDGVEGLLVPANHVEAMYVAIRRVLEDKDLANSLSWNARKHVEQFDWPKVLPKWDRLLNQIAIK